jgi:UDP-GlcNAc:undecaprenyl-phosphate GlcNAc-1-phosphate transferase
MAAYLAAFAILLATPLAANRMIADSMPLGWNIFGAAAIVFMVGLADDLLGLKPWQKIAGQALAACLAFRGGVQITALAGLTVPLWAGFGLTLLWLVGCANAFNLIDGMDGLATGAGLFATITILLGALLTNNVPLALATVPLAGALLGFLRYNFNPASIFLGDSGSLTLGFLLGCYSVIWGQKSATALGMTAPLMALAIPLLDTAIAIARRFLRQRPIFAADSGHIHHRLLARGLTPRKVALLLYGACGVAASLSLLASLARNQFKGLIVVLFCGAVCIGVRHLGYVEFSLAGRMFLSGAFLHRLNSELALQAFEEDLRAAATPDELWETVSAASRNFGFTHIELNVDGYYFDYVSPQAKGNPILNVDIPLRAGRLLLKSSFAEPLARTMLVPFAEVLQRIIGVHDIRREPAVGMSASESL